MVWDISLAAQLRAFPDAAAFAAPYLRDYYPENASARVDPAVALRAEAQAAYDAALCAHRMPPNTWTGSRDGGGLRMLADSARCNERYFVVYNLAPPSINASAAFVAEQLALIAPRVALAEANGLLDNAVVYGCDAGLSFPTGKYLYLFWCRSLTCTLLTYHACKHCPFSVVQISKYYFRKY